MKKLLTFAALFAVVALTSCKYDDDDIWNSVHGLENRVAKLEELCKQMNTNISSLQTIVTGCLLYTSPSPRDRSLSRMPSSA